MVLEKELEN